MYFRAGGGGTQLFFQVGVCGQHFRSVGLVNWSLPLKGVLWIKNKFQIWGSVNWKLAKIGGFESEDFGQIGVVEPKISHLFLIRGSCELTAAWNGTLVNYRLLKWDRALVNYRLLIWDPCELRERREKGVFRAAHPHTPFLGQYPPGLSVYTICTNTFCHNS